MITRTAMRQVKKPDDVPQGQHFAVIIYHQDRIDIPGDERSRTHPGHGYPAETRVLDTFQHWVTADKQVLLLFVAEIEQEQARQMYGSKDPFVVLNVEKKGVVAHKTEVVI